MLACCLGDAGLPAAAPIPLRRRSPSPSPLSACLPGCSGSSAQLRGCINDAKCMEYMLKSKFGFKQARERGEEGAGGGGGILKSQSLGSRRQEGKAGCRLVAWIDEWMDGWMDGQQEGAEQVAAALA